MKKLRLKLLFSTLAMLVVSASVATSAAFACSGVASSDGSSVINGMYCIGGSTPLQLSSQTVTFNVATTPTEWGDAAKYDATATVEYVLHNPTSDTVTEKLAYPVAAESNYRFDKSSVIAVQDPVKVDGVAVTPVLRHTYGGWQDYPTEATMIKDGYCETDFFKLDSPVTEYVLKASVVDGASVEFFAPIPKSLDDKTRYLANSDYNGNFRYTLTDGQKISIFTIGDEVDIANLGWTAVRYDYKLNRFVTVNATLALEKKMASVTFKDFVTSSYNTHGDVSEVDWFNAVYSVIDVQSVCVGSGVFIDERSFTAWNVYPVTVAAGATVTTSVTSNLYPTSSRYTTPPVYDYTFYLSADGGWADCGSVKVVVNTPFYMQANNYYDPYDAEKSTFVKTENGYEALLSSLPIGSFTFNVCSSQTPEYASATEGNLMGSFAVGVAITFGVLLLGAGITLLTVFLVHRKRKSAKGNGGIKSQGDSATVQQSESDGEKLLSAESPLAESCEKSDESLQTEECAENDSAEQTAAMQEENPDNGNEGGKKRFCTNCGTQLDGDARFCPVCGMPTDGKGRPEVSNAKKAINVFGIVGFVLSMIAIACLFLNEAFAWLWCLFSLAGFGLSLAGLILKRKYNRLYGFGIAGIVISVLQMVIVIFVLIAVLVALALMAFV